MVVLESMTSFGGDGGGSCWMRKKLSLSRATAHLLGVVGEERKESQRPLDL